MTWILTHKGHEHLLLAPPTDQYDLGEVAHALSQINRYTGHTVRPYSVAEHSLLCADMAHLGGFGAVVELCCLMHDAHEAYCGDVPSPIKLLLGDAWALFEQAQQDALLRALRLNEAMGEHAALVHQFDLVALATERRDLLPYSAKHNRPWPVIDTPGMTVHPFEGARLDTMKREQMHWTEWRDALRERFNQLAELSKQEHAQRINQCANED